MSYQVIARKYRPQRFSDVVGQDHVTRTLSNAIQQKRIAHAYLFVGPRGTGKTTLARIFAKCLNCTDGPRVNFDDSDPRCREITEGRSLDVLEIDGASNRGIEEIRELRETVKYVPASSRFKIYIIDEVHMLTKEAFNALLKTLEEPPAHVKFMFATTEPEKVLPTILSRCQRFDLRRIPAVLIVRHLAHIAELEGVKIDEAALFAIARGADGGMRDAESALDQLISFCGNEIFEADVLSMFGLTARAQVFALAHAVLAAEAETALRELNDLARNGKDLGRLLSDLLNHFRNLLLYQFTQGDLQLLEVTELEAATLKQQTESVTSEALTRVLEVLSDSESRLREAASKKIAFEVALLKVIQARHSVSVDLVLRKLQELKTEAASTGHGVVSSCTLSSSPAPALASIPNPTPSPIALPPRPAPISRETGIADLVSLWDKVVEAVGRVSPFAKTYLLEAHPVSFDKGVFTIGFDPEFADHLGLIDNAKNRTLIQTKLQELGMAEAQVKFIQSESPPYWSQRLTLSSNSGAAPAPENLSSAPASPKIPEPSKIDKDDFKNDPLIKQALEIFKGTIVEIRA